MNYYERYIGDYQRDTASLTLAQHGAFSMLLDTYFATEQPLPGSCDELYRICRAMTAAERDAVKKVAERFFPLADDGLRHNARADEMIPKARKRIEAAARNGRKGGRPAGKHLSQPGDLFDDMGVLQAEPAAPSAQPDVPDVSDESWQSAAQTVTAWPAEGPVASGNHPEMPPATTPSVVLQATQPESSPAPTPAKNKKHSSPATSTDAGFADFWAAWPATDRKTARAECLKRWRARGLGAFAAEIVADVERRKQADRQWQSGFEPAPLTYLNQRRWEDVPASAPNPFE